ncbi:protein split ends isoform X3 [Cimex lectularius]|uniref:Msx2-interacting protein n=1 Tax=Cimex lectularius TaxID=79782 RepID=A0A8I6SCC1_CIMLE|nr:protein split ends isoform X3 [Cimex lectularius]
MVRETRHLWVGNLPENIREDRIRDHFKRYGRVQSVKLLGRSSKDEENSSGGVCATVSFMDIKSAAKAHHSEQKLDERVLTTEYHEPAAIPGPSQVYGPSTATTNSTSTPRFSTHGGSEDLSGSFERSSHFYERSERSEGSGGSSYLRRSGTASATTGGYHTTESISRSRARDRIYRNGPYTPLIERDSKQRIGEPRKSSENDELVRHSRVVGRNQSSHHRVGSSWGYDSPSPRYSSQVPSTPELPYSEERRETTPVVHKKHSKSSISRRSGSDTGSNSGSSRSRSSSASSHSGSSTCSTASSSPTSEKSCSQHSQQSTLRSGPQSALTVTHTNSNSPAVHSDDRRPLAICVRNLPARSSDTSLKDGLYHEYKKHGKVTWVKVVGQGIDRYALVCFKKPEDVDKALQVSHDKLFFGCKIEVAPYQGYDVDDNEFRPFEAEQDEFHPKATRTLFIGNLEKDITTQEIRKHFEQFGEIIDIDIKKQGTSSSYAFCQFSDIGSVVKAMRTLDGEHIGSNRIKLGFGKSMHTNCVWVDGVSDTVSEKYLSQQFGQFGPVTHVVIDRVRGHGLVFFEQITYAQQAVKEMRGVVLRGRKLQVDYASRECQEAFYDRLEKQSNTNHPSFENNVQASPQSTVSTSSRVFDSQTVSSAAPSAPSSARFTGTPTAIGTSNRYSSSGAASRSYSRPAVTSPATSNTASPSTSIRSSRHSTSQRFEFSEYINERRSYRSYEDSNMEDGPSLPPSTASTTTGPGTGDIRHLQKERVALLEQLEDCPSSGEEGAGRRRCKHRRSQSGDGSRPGTPLCDERPENLPPMEPRRAPRERPPDPLSLPLPRFASQVLSPRPAPPSPPASPQTPHSSSSDSEPSPPPPEWEERLRSLDEKYEKWTGSRTGMTKVDPSTLKVRHIKLLDLDLHDLQPSDIVKSVLAKRSVFDEDSKRLENFSDKYEPREFVPTSRTNVLRRLDMSPLTSPVSKSPGLQYPFPSHPPAQLSGSVVTASTPAQPALTLASEMKQNTTPTFLSNCSRLLQPKIFPSPSTPIETSPRPSTQPPDKFKNKCPLPISQTIKKDLPTSLKSKPCPLRRDSVDEKAELRRKSRDEMIPDSAIKKDDTSESDKVKDAQVCERRKSAIEKRRNSVESKDSVAKDIVCDRPKDIVSDNKRDEKERRRISSELDISTDMETIKQKNDLKKFNQTESIEKSNDSLRSNEQEKLKKSSDNFERRKDNESVLRHNSTELYDKKKDTFVVNAERDKRRARESTDSSNDNPKHKKVPDKNKANDRKKDVFLENNFDAYIDRLKEDNSKTKDEKKNDFTDSKFKHHRDSKSKEDNSENCRLKEDKKREYEFHDRHKSTDKKDGHRIKEDKKTEDVLDGPKQKEDHKKDEWNDSVKSSKDEYSSLRKEKEQNDRKKEEKEQKRKERELHAAKKEIEERRRDREEKEKSKKNKDFDIHETKVNGDHDGEYSLDPIECRKTSITYEGNELRLESAKKEKRRDKTSWPATIGCKRRLSSQDSLDISEDPKRSKPERRDSKDSGRSSGSSRKGSGEKHNNKGFTKLLEEKIKEDKEREMRKKDEQETRQDEEKVLKPAPRKEKRNSGEKRKEERKFKIRVRENGTASDSDLGSGDEESKARKRQQHSIFDIVDDEPAYISMYDKVKARSTKNMQKQEEEKRQEKLKEKFHQLKQSRAKREEKKRSTSYDEDSDSEKGSIRRNKLLLTSSEDDGGSEGDIRSRSRKILYDTSEDDMIVSSRKNTYVFENDKCNRKIISDVSEDDTVIKRIPNKVKTSRNISFDSEPKTRKIMSDTSEDDNSRLMTTPRIMKPIRIHSDDSEGDLGFEDSIRTDPTKEFALNEIYSNRPEVANRYKNETNNSELTNETINQPLHSSPESFRRNSIDCGIVSEQPRKKSHKKKQKRQKNFEENEDGSIKKHSSKKEKKKSHKDDDEKKARKKRNERESSNKRDEKLEDIFGPLSDDSEKALGKWQVSQVYGSDSESERENIRKKEKKMRDKFHKEVDERYFSGDFLGSSENMVNSNEHIKKKKKRKKSRDEKIKHHQQRLEEKAVSTILPKEEKNDIVLEHHNVKEETKEVIVKQEIEEVRDINMMMQHEIKTEIKEEQDIIPQPPTISCLLDTLLDSPPPTQSSTPKKPDIPGFGSEVDETIHETAVKSISESPCTTLDESEIKFSDKSKNDDHSTVAEEKPTPTISQEETEDAVAALLISFGGGFEGYSEGTPKPDTPVSEPDLQIDTDTEDTYDQIDFPRTSNAPDSPGSFYRHNESREGLEERIMSLACSSENPLKDAPKLQIHHATEFKFEKKLNSTHYDSHNQEKSVITEKQIDIDDAMEVDGESHNQVQNANKDCIPEMIKVQEESQDKQLRNEFIEDDCKSTSMESKESEQEPEKSESSMKDKEPEQAPEDTNVSGQSLPIIQISAPKMPVPVPTLVPLNKPEVHSGLFQKVEVVTIQQQSPKPVNTVLVQQPQIQTAQIMKPPSQDDLPLTVQTPSSPNRTNPSSPVAYDLKASTPTSSISTAENSVNLSVSSSVVVQPKVADSVNVVQNKPQLGPPLISNQFSSQAIRPVTHRLPFQYPVPQMKPNPIPQIHPPTPQTQPAQIKPAPQPQQHVVQPVTKPSVSPLPSNESNSVPTNFSVHNVQKQLSVVTQNTHITSQPAVSPQNLKINRPIVTLSPVQTLTRPPLNTPQLPCLANPVPLIQPVKIEEHIKLPTPYPQSKTQIIPNSLLIHGPGQSAPHPERVINLSPSQPITSVNAQKTSVIKNSPNDLTTNDWHLKKVENKGLDLKTRMTENEMKMPLQEAQVKTHIGHPLKEPRRTPSPQNLTKEMTEPLSLQTKKPDDSKPLNAVIQDLTMRAVNKMWKQTVPQNEQKVDTPKPIEQVVRELTLRKKATAIENKETEPSIPLKDNNLQNEHLINARIESVKSEMKCSNNDVKENPTTPVPLEMTVHEPSKEVLHLEKQEPVEEMLKEVKKEEVEINEEALEIKHSPIRDNKSPIFEKKSPTSEKISLKFTPSDESPEMKSPKPHKEPEINDTPVEDKTPVRIEMQPVRGGRGGRRKRTVGRGGGVSTRRTRHSNTAPTPSTDVYEFRDDSEEETGRPRLILTIKSPPEQPAHVTRSRSPQQLPLAPTNNMTPTTTRKSRRLQVICNDIESSRAKQIDRERPNTCRTRSKRLQINFQEKDGRNTVDDTIDDVIRGRPGRRATRSTTHNLAPPTVLETVRKSPRRKQIAPPPPPSVQQPSSPPSSSPQPMTIIPTPPPAQSTPPTPTTTAQPPTTIMTTVTMAPGVPSSQPQHPMALGKLIRAGLQHSATEPTTLIDPVTGLLIPMRESEEGQYIPVHNDRASANMGNAVHKEPCEGEPPEKRQRMMQGEEAVARTTSARMSVVRPVAPQSVCSITAVSQPAAKVTMASSPSYGTPMDTTTNRSTAPSSMHSVSILSPKAHLLQGVAPSRVKLPPRGPTSPPAHFPKGPTPMTPKALILQSIGNAQAREVVVGSPAPHQGSLLTGSVASPPLRAHQQPMITGASSARVLIKGSPSEVGQGTRLGDGSCIVPGTSAHPAASRNQVMQAGMPIPAFEASLGEMVNYSPHHHMQTGTHYVSMFQQIFGDSSRMGPYSRPGGMVKVSDMDDRGGTGALSSPPLELRRGSPHDRATDSPQVANLYMHGSARHIFYEGLPPQPAQRPQPTPPSSGRLQVATPPHASQVPPQADSLLMLLQRYPVMWQGLLALKTDQAAVQMHFVFGNPRVASDSLPCNSDGSTPPLRIAQRMRLEPFQVEGVAKKMQTDDEHCTLLALPCGRDHLDVLQQSNNLQNGFITYLQQKQAAGIVNIAPPGATQAAYVVHIFPACDFANENLARIAPDLFHRVADLAHLVIVIATV